MDLTKQYFAWAASHPDAAGKLFADAALVHGYDPGLCLGRPGLLTAAETAEYLDSAARLCDLVLDLPARLFGGDLAAFGRALGYNDDEISLVADPQSAVRKPLLRPDFLRAADGFHLLEINAGSVLAGWEMAKLNRAALAHEEFARFAAEHGLVFEDSLDWFGQLIREASPRGAERSPFVAVVDSVYGFRKFRTVSDKVVASMQALKFDVVGCDANNLVIDGDRVSVRGREVDVVFRMFVVNELVPGGEDLARIRAIVAATGAGRTGLFDPLESECYGSKSCLALLSDEQYWSSLDADERAVVGKHLPATRFLRDETTVIAGERVPLARDVLAHKDDWVLKPTRPDEVGVLPGVSCERDRWERVIRERFRGPFVVQHRVDPVPEPFPRRHAPGEVDQMVVNWAPTFVGGQYVGSMLRALPVEKSAVINVHSGAWYGCVFHQSADMS